MPSTVTMVRHRKRGCRIYEGETIAPPSFRQKLLKPWHYIMIPEFRSKSWRDAAQSLGSRSTRQGECARAQGTDRMPKTVLIVEDNELNMKLFHDLLQANGYDTIETRNGIEALDLARKHKPDLILMDIQLPEVSGLEVTKWIKEDDELKSIPVIAVTAFAMKGDEERIREGGCEAYLSKPISVAKFLETVRHFVKQD